MRHRSGRRWRALRPVGALVSLALAAHGCGREPLGLRDEQVARGVALSLAFPTELGPSGQAAPTATFTHVRVVFRRLTGVAALDTTVAVPANADSLALPLDVPLSPDAPVTGEDVAVTLACINTLGDVVYRGGPVLVRLRAGQRTKPVVIPLTYTGGGPIGGVDSAVQLVVTTVLSTVTAGVALAPEILVT